MKVNCEVYRQTDFYNLTVCVQETVYASLPPACEQPSGRARLRPPAGPGSALTCTVYSRVDRQEYSTDLRSKLSIVAVASSSLASSPSGTTCTMQVQHVTDRSAGHQEAVLVRVEELAGPHGDPEHGDRHVPFHRADLNSGISRCGGLASPSQHITLHYTALLGDSGLFDSGKLW